MHEIGARISVSGIILFLLQTLLVSFSWMLEFHAPLVVLFSRIDRATTTIWEMRLPKRWSDVETDHLDRSARWEEFARNAPTSFMLKTNRDTKQNASHGDNDSNNNNNHLFQVQIYIFLVRNAKVLMRRNNHVTSNHWKKCVMKKIMRSVRYYAFAFLMQRPVKMSPCILATTSMDSSTCRY